MANPTQSPETWEGGGSTETGPGEHPLVSQRTSLSLHPPPGFLAHLAQGARSAGSGPEVVPVQLGPRNFHTADTRPRSHVPTLKALRDLSQQGRGVPRGGGAGKLGGSNMSAVRQGLGTKLGEEAARCQSQGSRREDCHLFPQFPFLFSKHS